MSVYKKGDNNDQPDNDHEQMGQSVQVRNGPVPLLCDECGIGARESYCENSPPTCTAWTCSRGGPPCYGGSQHACSCDIRQTPS